MSSFSAKISSSKSCQVLFALIFVLVLLLVLLSQKSFAQTAKLAWDQDSGAAGYILYYGPSSGNYTRSVNVGDTTSYALQDLSAKTYYIAIAAYDGSNNQSAYSPELVIDSLSASAASGGSISPSGSFFQAQGASQTFAITPASGYKVANVLVDGVSVGALTSYTLSNISASHIISATFSSAQTTLYTITASAGPGGSISPAGLFSVSSGANQTFSITPAAGYQISSVSVDGNSVGAVSSYTFSAVTATHTISAAFTPITSTAACTITASAGPGGSISPSGLVSVTPGASRTFTISPASGYCVSNVTVDGESAGAILSYTFSDVTASHTISATFAGTDEPPVADAGPNQTVAEGADVTLNGSNSISPGGSAITSYKWTQTGGASVELSSTSAAQPTFMAPSGQAGALTFRLTVENASGLTATGTSIVNVIANNLPPTANAGPDQTVTSGTPVTLNGSGSTAPGGNTLTYLWQQIDGPTATLSGRASCKTTFSAPQPASGFASMSFQLTVTDKYGLESTDICYVNICPSGQGPQAAAGATQIEAAGSVVSLDGSSSTDPDGAIAAYLWHQAAGSPETLSAPATANPYFTVNNPGKYGSPMVFRLTVQDSNGLRSRAYQTFSIGGPWQNAAGLGSGWYWLEWFGYFNIGNSPWIYHDTLGWLYCHATSTESIWFWDPEWDGRGGWWWTSSAVFPWIYSATENEWLYYDAKASTPGKRWFFTNGGQEATH